MCVGVLFAGRLSLISELTYGNMAVCILQTFHLLTNAACFFKAKRVRLRICACVRVNCTSLGVVNVLWECQCLRALVCVCARLVPHMCESVPLLGKSAARFASWHCAPLAGHSVRTACLSWSGHLSSLWRRVAELTEEKGGGICLSSRRTKNWHWALPSTAGQDPLAGDQHWFREETLLCFN